MQFDRLKRREFITLLGGAAAAWPFVARAQQPERMRRIGVLMGFDENDPVAKTYVSAFTQALADLGWIDGRNLRMDLHWGGSDINRIRAFNDASGAGQRAAHALASRLAPRMRVEVKIPEAAGADWNDVLQATG